MTLVTDTTAMRMAIQTSTRSTAKMLGASAIWLEICQPLSPLLCAESELEHDIDSGETREFRDTSGSFKIWVSRNNNYTVLRGLIKIYCAYKV